MSESNSKAGTKGTQEKGSCRGAPKGTPSNQGFSMVAYVPTMTYRVGFIVQLRNCTLARSTATHASDQRDGVSCVAHAATSIITYAQSRPVLTVVG